MGTTHVNVTVRNPTHPEKAWEGLFLVDTRVMNCLAPAKWARQIGLQPRGKRAYRFPDGTEVRVGRR